MFYEKRVNIIRSNSSEATEALVPCPWAPRQPHAQDRSISTVSQIKKKKKKDLRLTESDDPDPCKSFVCCEGGEPAWLQTPSTEPHKDLIARLKGKEGVERWYKRFSSAAAQSPVAIKQRKKVYYWCNATGRLKYNQ